MKFRLTLQVAVATAALAAATWLSAPAHAVTLSSSVQAASALPATVPNTQSLQNGGYLIGANPAAGPGHVTGDGVDETTLWSFNFAADPQYAAFLAEGGVAQALFSITLHTKFFIDGIGPPGAITGPSDGITGIFPRWNLSGAMTGVAGVYSRATFTTDLIGDVGLNPGEVMNWLTSHGGSFPMVFGDDAIVVDSSLTLVSAPVPEPGMWVLMSAGLLAMGCVVRRRRG
jgi:hypothetical protein